jgi:predicted metal-dependent peptidase/intein/homing endonuclease
MMPEKLQAARLKLAKERPYLGAALWAAVPVERPGIGSLAMDRWWRLYYDPAVAALPVDGLAGVLYHAICHLLRSHPERFESYERVIANLACFPPDTLLPAGVRIQHVATTTRDYTGDLIVLHCQAGVVAATPEHPFFVSRRRHRVGLNPVKRMPPEWLPAADIPVGAFILVPRIKEQHSLQYIDLTPFIEEGGRNRAVKEIPLLEDVAWLIGLWVAEGSANPTVRFSLGPKEIDLAERVQEITAHLGWSASICKTRTGLSVHLGTTVFGRWLKANCGCNAHTKHVPWVILAHENTSIRQAFIQGLVAGDGATYKRGKHTWLTVGTVSRALATDLVLLLAQDGIGAHVDVLRRGKRNIGTATVETPLLLYRVNWNPAGATETERTIGERKVRTRHSRWHADEYGVWYPVRFIERIPYRGPVYNLVNTSDHTYIANGFLVHNCDAEINDDLREEKVSLPGGAVYPDMFDPPLPEGGLAEEYYAELLRRRQHKEGRAFQGSGESGRSGQGGGESEAEAGRDGVDAGARQGHGPGAAAGGQSPTGGESRPGAGGSSGASEAGIAGGSPSSVSDGRPSQSPLSGLHPEGHSSGAAPGAGRCGSCATGQAEPWEEPPPDRSEIPGISAAEAELIRRQVAQEILRLARASRDRGEIPGHWRRWAEEKLKPRVDWRRELTSAVRKALASTQGAADYTYRRPSRRQVAYGEVVMPSLYAPIPEVAVVVDTSGSMSERQIAQALAEVAGVLRTLGNRTAVRVLAVDAAVQTCRMVFRPEQIELAGGGGTDMGVGLEAAVRPQAGRPRPDVVVVVTDGHTPWPERPPEGARVIVALVGDGESPAWARTVKVEV